MSEPADGRGPAALLRHVFDVGASQLAVLAVTLVGVWLCELSIPLLLGATVDAAVSRTDAFRTIVRNGMTTLCVAAVLYALHAAYLRSESRLVAEATRRLRTHLYARLLDQPLSFLAAIRTGETAHRIMRDSEVIDAHAIYLLADFPFSAMTVIGVLALMLWMQPSLGLVVLIVLAAVAVLAQIAGRPLGGMERDIHRRWARLGGCLQETLEGFRIIKAAGSETDELERLDRMNANLTRTEMKAGLVTARLEPLLQLAETLGFLAIAWYGAVLVFERTLTSGGLVAFIAYMELLREPIRNAGQYLGHYKQAHAVLARIGAWLEDLAPPPTKGTSLVDGALAVEVRDVSFTHPGAERATLDRISLAAMPGEIVAIVGGNGSGKSTLLDVILGLQPPNSGAVLAGGVALDDWDPAAWRMATSALFQEPFLFHTSLADNLRYAAPRATDAELQAVVAHCGLGPLLARLPEGIETIVGERGARLSGGERQLVALARALLRQPRVLVLDEPGAALDSAVSDIIRRTLCERRESRITFVVAHDRETIDIADRVIILEKGRIVFDGNSWERERMGDVPAPVGGNGEPDRPKTMNGRPTHRTGTLEFGATAMQRPEPLGGML